MLGALAPVGMPLAPDVVSGKRAAAGFSRPMLERIRVGLQPPGRLVVGACKRSAWDTRASLASPPDWYWSPWPWTGTTAAAMAAGSTVGVTQGEAGA